MKTTGIAATCITPSGIGFLCEIATGARAQVIDCATDADADAPLERNAAPWVVAGATHVCASTEEHVIFGKCSGYPSIGHGIEFLT